jgi:transcriptional regulator with XRE-family HTH domain
VSSGEQRFTTQVFGDRLRELSDARGPYSQIARDLGVNRQQFARYINGTSLPRDALVSRIAEYFDVDPGVFFQQQSPKEEDVLTDDINNTVTSALMTWMTKIEQEPISEYDLASGLFMQYKQSFTQPDKVVCMMSRIYRDDLGVVRCKRRYSIKVIKDLPGVRVSHVSHGIFVKTHGALVLFDLDGVAGDLVFSTFKASSMFSVASRVKTGIVMTHGNPGNWGPVAGRHILERVPKDESSLIWARRQGFRDVSELPDYIQYHFVAPTSVPADVMTVR